MNFDELLEKYKAGSATAEEQKTVEEELNKYRALENYVYTFGELSEEEDNFTGEEERKEIKIINRKVNRKMRRNVFAAVAAVVILAALARPVGNLLFYNPNKGIPSTYGADGQFFLDASVFTELHSPGYAVSSAQAVCDGPGTYQVSIRQSNLFIGKEEEYRDRIVRGHVSGKTGLTSFFPNMGDRAFSSLNAFWHFPPLNILGMKQGFFSVVDVNGEEHFSQTKEDFDFYMETLRELPESSWVSAYFTFTDDLSMEDFEALYKKWNDGTNDVDILFAAVRSEDSGMVTGFAPNTYGVQLSESQLPAEDYLRLNWGASGDGSPGTGNTANEKKADIWRTHFCSMLRYMSERSGFLQAMGRVNGLSTEYYSKQLAYMEENGIAIYGVLVQGSVEQVMAFGGQQQVDGMDVNDVKLSVLSHH